MTKTKPAGIYVHIPFCMKKCPYCDFYSITDFSLRPPFLEALKREMSVSADVPFQFDTLYFGGGTPSVFEPEHICQIMETAFQCFSFLPDTETTIEVNPGTVSSEQISAYRHVGINRINIGVQSFQDENLRFLGRIHSSQDAHLAIRWAREAGFDNLGLDLIYGLPGQTKDKWQSDLHRAVEYAPEHLSCYTLTYEPGTALDKGRQKGRFCPLADGRVADMFKMTIEFLDHQGYAQYEVSNFARSISKRSRHNQKYWCDVPYLGFGPSAHSFTEPERYWNYRSVERYVQALGSGRHPIEEKEVLNQEQRMTEALYLGLRKTDGIDIDRFDKKFNVSFDRLLGERIRPLMEEGLMRMTQNHCMLSREGMLFLDSIVSGLV